MFDDLSHTPVELLFPSAGVMQRQPARDRVQLDIGLVNNMPDAALKGTERQFLSLLEASAGEEFRIRIHHFSLREILRGEVALRHMRGRYADASAIPLFELDGLIVTGNEPRKASLKDELHWKSLTALVDMAIELALPTVWSCLAAHAAVLHLDGIQRRALGSKRFGLFVCEAEADHCFLKNVQSAFVTPHSRYNEVVADDLLDAGYRILTRSQDAGVDAFVKNVGCDFIFLQGHPEYDAGTLLSEYRRDVLRFLSAQREDFPSFPRNYLDFELEECLSYLARQATADRSSMSDEEFVRIIAEAKPSNRWRPHAVTIYRNWLMYLAGRKTRSSIAVSPPAHMPANLGAQTHV